MTHKRRSETYTEKAAAYDRYVQDMVWREIEKGNDSESLLYLIAQKLEAHMKELDFL